MSDTEDEFQSADEWEESSSVAKEVDSSVAKEVDCSVAKEVDSSFDKEASRGSADVCVQSVDHSTTQTADVPSTPSGDASVKSSGGTAKPAENKEDKCKVKDQKSNSNTASTQSKDSNSKSANKQSKRKGRSKGNAKTANVSETLKESDTAKSTTERLAGTEKEMSGVKQEVPEERQEVSGENQEVSNEKQEVSSEKQEVSGEKQEASGEKQEVSDEKQEVSDEKQRVSCEKQEVSGEKQEVSEELAVEPTSAYQQSILKDVNPSDTTLAEPTQSDISTSDIDQSSVSHVDADKSLEEDSHQSEDVTLDNKKSEASFEPAADSCVASSAGADPKRSVAEPVHSADEEKDVSRLFDKLSMAADAKKEPARDSKEESVLEKLSLAGEQKQQQSSGWGSWGSWGSSLLNTATSSINTFTGQVSEGMHTVVETFEASVGAPPANELASEISQHVKEPDEEEELISKQSVDEVKEIESCKDAAAATTDVPTEVQANAAAAAANDVDGSDWFASWGVSEITNQLHSKTKGLVESGLDVLETIGKKTMEQIKETDPGYTKTKGLLRGNVTNLSQALREAKEENEKKAAEENSSESLINYSTLFDEHKGLLSLEALELLSITATEAVGSAQDVTEERQQRLDALSEKFNALHDTEEDNADENYNFGSCLDEATERMGIPIKFERIVGVQQQSQAWLEDCQKRQDAGERIEGMDIHKAAINSFAEVTSCAMELYHKSAVLLSHDLLGDNLIDVDLVSSCFVSILKLVNKEITILSHKYNECLNTAADDSENPDSINPMIVDVFLEASNSTSYVRDAFKLLLPVLQRFELSAKTEVSSDPTT